MYIRPWAHSWLNESLDIAQFLGLFLLSVYHCVSTKNDYWSTSEDMNIPITSTVMSRNKFRDIARNFHLMDNNLQIPGDKLDKIQPL